MSKLLGIVNPNIPAEHPFLHWLWRATGIPWEAEALNIQRFENADEGGNTLFIVRGPHTALYPDGVFVKIYINPNLDPKIKISGAPTGPWADPRPEQTILAPQTPGSEQIAGPLEEWSGQGRL